MKYRVAFRGFLLAALALALVPCRLCAQEMQRVYLSGHGKDDAVPWRFQCTSGAHSGYWTNLPVPSNWEMHGFGSLNYQKDPTNAWNERGIYQFDFAAPQEWAGQRVFLVFDGVMTDTRASLNGESVGPVHQGSFYRFKYEVTQHLKPGATNRLEVDVAKHSTNESVNNAERMADYWVFGGIYRPVFLEAVPPQFIERVAIDARADGAFAMDVFLNGVTNADAVEAQIITLDGKTVGQTFASDRLVPNLPDDTPLVSLRRPFAGKGTLRTTIPNPSQWTAETPNLYFVEVRLKRGNEVLHRVKQRFGFRTMEVRDGDGLYVNGRRVILKGACRHSFWPDSGRCLSEAVHRLDIETMKDMNMNAVRMSHYPPDEQFLDLCDLLGLYVLDELGGWQKCYDTQVGRKLVEEMVPRDVNHPSILFWDNGNEGGWNTNLDAEFPRWDPQQRRVLHPWATFSGVNTSHYLAYDRAEAAANATNSAIYMPTEFLHGLYDGGAGAGMEDYWKMMTASKHLGGGFVWVLEDDAVKRPDTGRLDTAGNQAPDGIVGPYRQREPSFYTIKELWSPIQVTRASSRSFTIENRYSFTDASECKFRWRFGSFPFRGETNSHSAFRDIDFGNAVNYSIPPGGKTNVQFSIYELHRQITEIALRVEDRTGRELWTWDWQIGTDLEATTAQTVDALFGPTNSTRVEVTGDSIRLESRGLAIRIDKATGLLGSVQLGSRGFSLANGPRLAVGGAMLTSIESNQEGRDAIVTETFTGDLKRVIWRLHPDGKLQCDYAYTATGPHDFFGVVFDYPEALVKHKRWLGDGPFRVWKNRLRGVTCNVWENDFNNTITGWRDWVYPEFKGCFANVRWLQLDTTEGRITVVPENIPYVQVLTPDQPPDNLVGKTKVNLPKCGLGFLHAIPPIGTKFNEPKRGGPQGQPNLGAGEYSGSVSFYFGELPRS